MNPIAPSLLPEKVLNDARLSAKKKGVSLVAELENLTGIGDRELLLALAQRFALKVASIQEMQAWIPAFEILPLPKALRQGAVLFHGENGLIGVISDPFDGDKQQWLESLTSASVTLYLALDKEIQALLRLAEGQASAIESSPAITTGDEPTHRQGVEQLSLQSISEDNSPVVRFVNSTLYDALKAGASDIHLECSPTGMVVRYRIDGVLDTVTSIIGIERTEQAISRIKVMAELDIAERRVPQDGRFRVAINGRDVDIRVSIMPGNHGEDAVLRILDKRTFIADNQSLRLDMLGFDTASLTTVRRLAHEPYGMLLVTGPTGSGKTTTLYAAISETNHRRDKIITIEDPVEYELPGVLQIPVNEKKGLTFAKGLRSILRHDPDKIMVGEIRDRETAEIAVQSALTGHLVLTTVHANNVFDVFSRFTHMGIDAYSLTSALNGIWAQRLVRVICRHCAESYFPSPETLIVHGLDSADTSDFQFKFGRGCGECRGSGYKGRKAIAEILSLNDHLREMITSKQPVSLIKDEARRCGTRYLREAAIDMVRLGETTLEEVGRVTLSA
ncbi:MAG: type II/IV secretion system protein [Dechloromonas sp.]|nr:type II/IV secretion system protein [Dechloromonas sp.]